MTNINNISKTIEFPKKNEIAVYSAWEKRKDGQYQQARVFVNAKGDIRTELVIRRAFFQRLGRLFGDECGIKRYAYKKFSTTVDGKTLEALFKSRIDPQTNFLETEKDTIVHLMRKTKTVAFFFKALEGHIGDLKNDQSLCKGQFKKPSHPPKYTFDPSIKPKTLSKPVPPKIIRQFPPGKHHAVKVSKSPSLPTIPE